MPQFPAKLAALVLLALPLPALAEPQQRGIHIKGGVTDQGTRYRGTAQLETIGDETVCKAYLYFEGINSPEGTPVTVRFRVPIPAEHAQRNLIGIEVRERGAQQPPAEGPGFTGVLQGKPGKLTGIPGKPGGAKLAKQKSAEDFQVIPLLEADYLVSIVADSEEPDATVPVEALVGQEARFRARLVTKDGVELPADSCAYRWSPPRDETLHSYTLDVEQNPDGTEGAFYHGRKDAQQPGEYIEGRQRYLGITSLTPQRMTSQDLSNQTLSFYWTHEREAAPVRLTAVRDAVDDGSVQIAAVTTEVDVSVRRSEIPAREVFTVGELPGSFGAVLPNHANWHYNYRGTEKFIYFHREFVRVYNAWRRLFGYLEVQAETDPTKPGYGLDIADYAYLTEGGGSVASPRHQATKLGDFASVRDLGDDLESPFHNQGHGAIASDPNGDRDMGSVANAPKCEYFFQWHTKVDNVAVEYEYLHDLPLPKGMDAVGLPGGPKLQHGPGKVDLTGAWVVTGTGRDGQAFKGVAAITRGKLGDFRAVAQGDEFSWILQVQALSEDTLEVQVVHDEHQLTLFPGPGNPSGVHRAPHGEFALAGDSFQQGGLTFTRAPTPTFAFDPASLRIEQGQRTTDVRLTSTANHPDAMHLVYFDGGFSLLGSEMDGPNLRLSLAGLEPGAHEIQAFVRGVAEPVATFTLIVE